MRDTIFLFSLCWFVFFISFSRKNTILHVTCAKVLKRSNIGAEAMKSHINGNTIRMEKVKLRQIWRFWKPSQKQNFKSNQRSEKVQTENIKPTQSPILLVQKTTEAKTGKPLKPISVRKAEILIATKSVYLIFGITVQTILHRFANLCSKIVQ